MFNMAININKHSSIIDCHLLGINFFSLNKNHNAVTANIIIIEELVNIINQPPNEACINCYKIDQNKPLK